MIGAANYIVPYFNNQLRLDKPPLTYWHRFELSRFSEKTICCSLPFGNSSGHLRPINLAWGRRLGGKKLGWWAAIISTLSLKPRSRESRRRRHVARVVRDPGELAGYELFSTPNATTNAQH